MVNVPARAQPHKDSSHVIDQLMLAEDSSLRLIDTKRVVMRLNSPWEHAFRLVRDESAIRQHRTQFCCHFSVFRWRRWRQMTVVPQVLRAYWMY